jgi:hypothetical protein
VVADLNDARSAGRNGWTRSESALLCCGQKLGSEFWLSLDQHGCVELACSFAVAAAGYALNLIGPAILDAASAAMDSSGPSRRPVKRQKVE